MTAFFRVMFVVVFVTSQRLTRTFARGVLDDWCFCSFLVGGYLIEPYLTCVRHLA